VDEKSHFLHIILQIPDQLASLLGNPGHARVGRAACQIEATGSQFDGEEYVDGLKPDGLHCEEITNQDWS
jgi:hypothetical protein